MRVGFGYDVHRLVAGRTLVLGGVRIPSERGLLGHSDGDVVCHALADALLGALGERDIGFYYPPTDPRWEGADSWQLLREVAGRVPARGLRLANADVTIIAEAPRLAPHVPAMRARLAEALGGEVRQVSVKATTNEGLGFLGRGEGIAALAVVLLRNGRAEAGPAAG